MSTARARTTRRRPFWAYGYTSFDIGSIYPETFVINNNYTTCTIGIDRFGVSDSNFCKRAFGSNHPGGTNFAFADGSVHFIKQSINRITLVQLATIAGGEVISSDQY